MLKVVGASWEQTRLTSIILGTVIVLAVIAIFFYEVPLVINDGFYAATVYWSAATNFRVMYWGQNNDPKLIKPGAARAYYRPDSTNTGWATLEIQTTESYPDWVQAYSAGLLEGSLCWQMIYWHWQNTVATTCKGREEFCNKMRSEVLDNEQRMRKEAHDKDKTEPYWHQVNLFYIQLDGLEEGWHNGVTRSRKDKIISIPHVDFIWMNSASDLRDLELQYNVSKHYDPSKPATSLALLKYLPNSESKFLLAHATAGYYNEMLRMQKKYNFNFHMTGEEDSSLVPGNTAIFTSYPASLHSQDDFYKVSGKKNFTIAGSSIKNYNSTLWFQSDLDKVFIGPRVVAANRLANSSSSWSRFMGKDNSGTGNKEWMVVEMEDDEPKLWIVEQMPGLTIGREMTQFWHNKTYWANYGVPYFEEIKNISGYKEGGKASHFVNRMKSISSIFTESQKNITSKIAMLKLMRRPEITAVGRSDILVVNISSNSDDHVVGESGFSVNYNPNKNNPNDKSSNQIDSKGTNSINKKSGDEDLPVSHSKGFHDVFQDMIDIKGADDRLKDGSQKDTKGNYHRIHVFDKDSKDGFREYDGIIDLKISIGQNRFEAAAGPLFTDISDKVKVEPFQWSRSSRNEIPHYGQSDVWNFEPVSTTWVW